MPNGWLRNATRLGASVVFLHFATPNPDLVERARKALWARRIRTIYIMPVPVWPESVPKDLYYEVQNAGRAIRTKTIRDYDQEIVALSRYLAKPRSGLSVLKIVDAFCDPGCHRADDANHPYYFGGDHLTLTGYRLLEPRLANTMKTVAK